MSKPVQPFVSVVIPVFNDAERLKLCLAALEHQTYPQNLYEVIVVDNDSAESVEPVVSQFSQAIALFESLRGSYAARNKGILQAQGEIIAFTDSDCIPAADWLEKGTAQLLNTPHCGLVAGEIKFFFKTPDRPTGIELYDTLTYFKQKDYVEKDRFGATANVFTLRRVLDDVGFFNAQLKAGGDREWGQRVFAAGYKQSYANDVCVAHPARASLTEVLEKAVRVAKGGSDLKSKLAVSLPTYLKALYVGFKPPCESSGGSAQTHGCQPFSKRSSLRSRLSLSNMQMPG